LLEHLQIRGGRSPRKYSDLQPEHEPLLVAWARFRPSFYPGKITFLQSDILTSYPNAIRIWGNLTQELEIHKVPGDHVGIVTLHAESAAKLLSKCLDRALSSSR
jgi:hypothetical protein